jgi:quercetin dioxygenase-like cupin family protein
MRLLRIFATCVLATLVTVSASAQDKASVVPIAKTKFASLDGLPKCLTLSSQRGDPSKDGAVILIKMPAGCRVPWHWHTAAESLLFVGGKGKIEMRDAATQNLAAGDYVYLPGKHQHEFTCVAACTFFDVTEGAFDIHYVDKDGKEIPPADALKAPVKPAAAAGEKKKK